MKKSNVKTADEKTKQNKKKKRNKHPIIKFIFRTILLILLVLIIYFAIKVVMNGGGLSGVVKTVVGTSNSEIKNLQDLYVLCVGESQGMTDTIMVAKYNPREQQVTMVSVPRDSFVGSSQETATPYDKINARYSEGVNSLIKCVNNLTGLNIKYYIKVDTKALRSLVDAIGGVWYDVPIDMDYDDEGQKLSIDLRAGYQLLNGEQAEGLVRFRHNNDGSSYPVSYGDNDLGRMKTQRAFIKEVLKQTMKASNITKINQLLDIAQKEVETNIPWDVAKNYVGALMDFNTDNMISDTLPGRAQYINGYSFFLVNASQAKTLVQKMFLSTIETITETNTTDENTTNTSTNKIKENQTNYISTYDVKEEDITIEIYNGTGSSDKYTKAINQLKKQGYKVIKRESINIVQKTAIINRTQQSTNVNNAITSLLCVGTVSTGENNKNVDYTILLGIDY